VPSGVRLGSLPLATSEACDPGRRIDARLLTFRARAADQAHAAFTPGTAWPVIGRPPGPSRENSQTLAFDAPSIFANDASTAHARPKASGRALSGTSSRSPPDAIKRLLPVAHRDGLQPTQHRVVWRPPPKDDAGGPTSLHLQHSTAHITGRVSRDTRASPRARRRLFAGRAPARGRLPGRLAMQGEGGDGERVGELVGTSGMHRFVGSRPLRSVTCSRRGAR
jgi:hypothetical protein